eukprot:s3665_g1.t1
MLSEVNSVRLTPDCITYGASISACEQASRWMQVLYLLS